jgi:hypothetical protein
MGLVNQLHEPTTFSALGGRTSSRRSSVDVAELGLGGYGQSGPFSTTATWSTA